MKRVWAILLMALCLLLAVSAACAEEIRIEGINSDGTVTMHGGVLDLFFEGGEFDKIYRVKLSFENQHGAELERHAVFLGGRGTSLYDWMASAPGAYGPFQLSITSGETVVQETTFMGVVPDGAMEVTAGYGSIEDEYPYSPAPEFVTVLEGDPEAEGQKTASLEMVEPLDRSVLAGSADCGVFMLWQCNVEGPEITQEIIDLDTNQVVYSSEFGEAWEATFGDTTPGGILELNHAYACRITCGEESITSRFYLIDEADWPCENPWGDDAPAAPAAAQTESWPEESELPADPPAEETSSTVLDDLTIDLSDGMILKPEIDAFFMRTYQFYGTPEGVDTMMLPLSTGEGGSYNGLLRLPTSSKQLVRPFLMMRFSDPEPVTITKASVTENLRSELEWQMTFSASAVDAAGIVSTLDAAQMDKLFLSKGNEIPWHVFEDTVILTGDRGSSWQIVPFALRDGGKGAYNKEIYLYAQSYAAVNQGEQQKLGLMEAVITDQEIVKSVIAACYNELLDRPYIEVADLIRWLTD